MLGVGFHQDLCKGGIGQCLDMDGTASNATITTLSSLSLAPGEYLFEFEYGNNTFSDNTLSYSLAGLVSGTVGPNITGHTLESQTFSVATLSNATISFISGGTANNGGAILNNVTLTQVSTVPAPALSYLLGIALLGFIGEKRKLLSF